MLMENTKKLSAKYLLAAMKEKDITAEAVAAELDLILQDFYTCSSKREGESLTIHFLNGQSFKLTVNKI